VYCRAWLQGLPERAAVEQALAVSARVARALAVSVRVARALAVQVVPAFFLVKWSAVPVTWSAVPATWSAVSVTRLAVPATWSAGLNSPVSRSCSYHLAARYSRLWSRCRTPRAAVRN